MTDLIDRQAAIEALDAIASELHERKRLDEEYIASWCAEVIEDLPSAEPELDKKDMPEQGDSAKFGVITGETCAYWDRESNFCALHRPSAQPEIIRCKDCKWKQGAECVMFADLRVYPDDFCSRAERRTDE